MSMHYGGEQGYGLFLNREEAAAFEHEYATTNYLCEDKEDEEDEEGEVCSQTTPPPKGARLVTGSGRSRYSLVD